MSAVVLGAAGGLLARSDAALAHHLYPNCPSGYSGSFSVSSHVHCAGHTQRSNGTWYCINLTFNEDVYNGYCSKNKRLYYGSQCVGPAGCTWR